MALDLMQELRRLLLERALKAYDDPDKALAAASEMAEFIIAGNGRNDSHQRRPGEQWRTRDSGHAVSSHAPWTPELDDQVRRMWGEGRRVTEIAWHLGRTPASINARVQILKLPKRRHWSKP